MSQSDQSACRTRIAARYSWHVPYGHMKRQVMTACNHLLRGVTTAWTLGLPRFAIPTRRPGNRQQVSLHVDNLVLAVRRGKKFFMRLIGRDGAVD